MDDEKDQNSTEEHPGDEEGEEEFFEDYEEEAEESAEEPGAEAYAGQYPILKSLGGGEDVGTFLCQDPSREGVQVVQKRFSEKISNDINDLVECHLAALGRLSHPNLALILDAAWEEGEAFLLREYVSGNPLFQAVAPFKLEQKIEVLFQLLGALEYLHSRNVHHLNLKPENLFLVSDGAYPLGRLKVTDFGIADILHGPDSGIGEGSNVGTPPYTAPEYAIRPGPEPRADLYSVGVIAYEIIGGRPPFEGSDPVTLLQAQLKSDPPPLSRLVKSLPKGLSDWVDRMVSRDLQKRFANPAEAKFALEQAVKRFQASDSLPFLAPDKVFRYKNNVKMFRRIALQGRKWAFEGKRGSGKSFFARWIQRYFWINQKPVRFFHGEDLPLLQGDMVLNPSEPTFVIIDDADRAPVKAWLGNRPYVHVVIFGEDLTWAKEDSQWQFFPMENLSKEDLKPALESAYGSLDEKTLGELEKHNKGVPALMVRQGRDLYREGVLQREPGGWKFSSSKYFQSDSAAHGVVIGTLLPNLDQSYRRILSLLALVQIPLCAAEVAAYLNGTESGIRTQMLALAFEDLLERRIFMGEEYFQANIPVPVRLDDSVEESEVRTWIGALEVSGWFAAGVMAINRYFSEDRIKKDSDLVLLRAKLLMESGNHNEVLKWITSPFVGTLSGLDKGRAFEILGRSLEALGRDPQAESAFKNAFNQYRSDSDTAGQARVLRDLGLMTLKAHDQERALKFYGQALAMAEKDEALGVLLGSIHLQVGDLYTAATDYENAETQYQSSIELFQHSPSQAMLGRAYLQFAKVNWERGESETAEYYAREALRLALFKEDRVLQGDIYLFLSILEEARSNQGTVLERLNEAVFALSKTADKSSYAGALLNRAYFYEVNRQIQAAEEDGREALNMAQVLKDPSLIGRSHLVLGKIRRRDTERLKEALKQFELARDEFEKSQDLKWVWECEFEKGEIERNRNKPEVARGYYDQALRALDGYAQHLSPEAKERFLKDGKRDRIEMALRWLQ